jgi:uncharacterized protein YidB (DUF937 family)
MMSMLKRVIRTAVISALGAKLARGRSPLVAALLTLLATRALSGREEPSETTKTGSDAGGLGGLVDKFRQGGLEEIIKSWIGTEPNQSITPTQLQQALGPQAVDDLARQSEMPRDDLLSQLSCLLPEIVDKLTPQGKLPPASDLVAEPEQAERAREQTKV